MVATGRYLVNKWSISIPILALVVLLAAMAVLFSTQSTWAQEADAPCPDTEPCDYAENGTGDVATYSARDPEGLGISWDVTGPDAADFNIVGGVLRFNDPPDYEDASDRAWDADGDDTINPDNEGAGDNSYEIVVRATEVRPTGDTSAAQTTAIPVTVTVTNVDEDGTVRMSRRQPQVGGAGLTVLDLLTDADGNIDNEEYRWSIPKTSRPELDDDDHWQPAGNTNNEAAYQPVASDMGSYLRVKVSYTDGETEGGTKVAYAKSTFHVRAAPSANDPPGLDNTDITRSVPENAAVGADVGDPFVATDSNSDPLTFVLTGTHASSFAIDWAMGQITVASELNHEDASLTDGAYSVTVNVFDPNNASASQTVTITATDVNEAPTVGGENTNTNADAEIEVNETSNLGTALNGTTVTDNVYTPRDVDADDGPEDVTLSLEGDDADVFKLSADPVTTDAANDRALTFKSAPNFEAPMDVNGDNVYKVTVMATDDEGLIGKQPVTVIVKNIDETGSVTLSSIQPQVDVALRATLGDPDGDETGVMWQWSKALIHTLATTGSDGNTFVEIEDATSSSYVPVEGDIGYFLRVVVTYRDAQSVADDPDTQDDESLAGNRTIGSLTDPQDDPPVHSPTSANAVRKAPETNDPPEFAAEAREIDENSPAETNVGDPVRATDGDEDVLTYSLSGGADMGSFDINSGTGQITVGEGTDLDYEEGKRSYTVVVKAEDPFAASATVTVIITVLDVDEAPTLEGDQPEPYAENGTGDVATYSARDPEGLGISWDVTGPDAADFNIVGGVLRFNDPPDYEDASDRAWDADGDDTINPDNEGEDDNSYEIVVRATEVKATGAAQTTTMPVTVTVTNVEEDGTVRMSRRQPQVGAVGLTVLDLLTDADGNIDNEEYRWSIPKTSRPELDDDDHWQPAGNTNNEAAYQPVAGDVGSYLRVKVSYTDGETEGGTKVAYAKSTFQVRATPTANTGPSLDSTDITRSVPENAAVGADVGDPFVATDSNSDPLTFVLTGTHASSFAIDWAMGQITVASELNHEDASLTDGAYSVTVNVFDPNNASASQTVTITATDVNEAPTVGGENTNTNADAEIEVNETSNLGTALNGTTVTDNVYTPRDVDADDGPEDVTLSLEGDDADVFKLSADPVTTDAANDRALTFKSAPNFEAPMDVNGDNVYKVTVMATDDEGLIGKQPVTVIVKNIDETGSVTLSSIQPQVDVALRATLGDPDGGETGVMWQWSKALIHTLATTGSDGNTFVEIEDATSSSYVPVEGDIGYFLRVVVTYRDAQSVADDPDTQDDESLAGNRTIGSLTDPQDDPPVHSPTSANAVRKAPETNDPPEFAAEAREIDENSPAETNVGDPVRATDGDEDVLTYSLSGGADMGSFDINSGTGQITVGEGTDLDYEEGKRSYTVVVKAEDPFAASATVTVIITVLDVDEPPVFGEGPQPLTSIQGDRSISYDENTMDVVESYEAMGTEADQAVWSLSGDDADDLRINNVGELTFATAPDYEDPADADMDNVYEVTVVAMAGTATQEAAVTVTVADVDEGGTGDDLVDRYDTDDSGSIDKDEVLTAIDDYLFGTGADAISKDDVLRLIDLYLFS